MSRCRERRESLVCKGRMKTTCIELETNKRERFAWLHPDSFWVLVLFLPQLLSDTCVLVINLPPLDSHSCFLRLRVFLNWQQDSTVFPLPEMPFYFCPKMQSLFLKSSSCLDHRRPLMHAISYLLKLLSSGQGSTMFFLSAPRIWGSAWHMVSTDGY